MAMSVGTNDRCHFDPRYIGIQFHQDPEFFLLCRFLLSVRTVHQPVLTPNALNVMPSETFSTKFCISDV